MNNLFCSFIIGKWIRKWIKPVIAVIFFDRKTSLSCHFTEGNAQGETRTRTNLSSTDFKYVYRVYTSVYDSGNQE